jgi:hypothetical protein
MAMSEEFLEREILGRVRMDRRSFVKKLVAGAVFAVPVVASFDMLTSQSGYGVASANGARLAAICARKEAERQIAQTQLANLPPNAPAARRTRLQNRINTLTAFINANC